MNLLPWRFPRTSVARLILYSGQLGLVLLCFSGCDSSRQPPLKSEQGIEKDSRQSSVDPLSPEQNSKPNAADSIEANIAGPEAGEPVPLQKAEEPDQEQASNATATPNVIVPTQGDQESWTDWPEPTAVLFVTGQQHGYIEPCGCTGLENQKGGMARRMTLLNQLRQRDWKVVPIDGGNQVRRFGRQATIKFQTTVTAFEEMDYLAVGFGPGDLRLGIGELLSVAASEGDHPSMFVSANVTLFDPEMIPRVKKLDVEGLPIVVTAVLDPKAIDFDLEEEMIVGKVDDALKEIASQMDDQAAFRVLTFLGSEESAIDAIQSASENLFDLVVVAGGYGEPTYQAQSIPKSKTKMIVTGAKGMYVGLVGLFADGSMRYARVALTDQFPDSKPMLGLLESYQDQLKELGLERLGLRSIPHPNGDQFVGSKACGECHTTAFDIWEGTPHVHATESLVHPPNSRGEIARHFDPECLSCHVTGWNPQNYYPYASGYLDLEASKHLLGNGCENCHGPGAQHSAAERKDSKISKEVRDSLRQGMQLPLSRAKEKCMACHDLDNSPDFHKEDAFEDEYWPEIEHIGMD